MNISIHISVTKLLLFLRTKLANLVSVDTMLIYIMLLYWSALDSILTMIRLFMLVLILHMLLDADLVGTSEQSVDASLPLKILDYPTSTICKMNADYPLTPTILTHDSWWYSSFWTHLNWRSCLLSSTTLSPSADKPLHPIDSNAISTLHILYSLPLNKCLLVSYPCLTNTVQDYQEGCS